MVELQFGEHALNEEAEQPGLAVKYVRSTSLGWLRIVLVRGTQVFYLFFMARWLTQVEMGHVQTLALGLSFIGGIVTPWIGWVLQQRALAESDPKSSIRLVHQMAVYGFIASFIFAPAISVIYLLTAQIPILSEEGLLFIAIAVAVCLLALLQRVYLAFLKIEMNVIVGAIRIISNYLLPMTLFLLTWNVTMIFWGWLAADLLVLLFILPTCGLRRNPSLYRLLCPSRDLLLFSAPLFIIYLFHSLRSFVDRFIIMLFFGEANLAIYHLVSRITSITSEAILTLLIPFLPIMTKVFEDRPQRAGIALSASLKMLFHAILFVAPLLIFCGAPIINLILGDQYTTPESCLILAIASLSMIFTAFTALFTKIRGAKGDTHKMLLEISYVAGAFLFLSLFSLFGWLQVLEAIGIAICMALGNLLAFLFIGWQTKELSLINKGSFLRLLLLIIPHTLLVPSLSLWLAPVDLFDLILIAGVSLLSLVFFSALLSCLSEDELEILSRVSKGKIDPLIRLYQKIGVRF